VSDSKKLCLLTGYPGFLGSTFYHQFQTTYAVHTLGLTPAQTPNHLVADLSHGIPDIPDLLYDLVVHAAGKAHTVPRTPAEESLFFRVNHQGTVNLITALGQLQEAPRAFVLISTVAVYGKNEGQCISETEPLIANDAYGLSKIMAEEAVLSWKQPKTVKAIIRLPLVVGKNPPGNLGRMLTAIEKGRYLNIGGGKARRSLLWIEDIAPFIIRLVEAGGGTYNLTDGVGASLDELYTVLCDQLNKVKRPCLPKYVARILAAIGDSLEWILRRQMAFDRNTYNKLTRDLTFSADRAIRDFNWVPTKAIDRIREILP